MTTETGPAPRFTVGDRVRVTTDPPTVIAARRSLFVGTQALSSPSTVPSVDPERLAYHLPGLPAQVLYKVRFHQPDFWPGYRAVQRISLRSTYSKIGY